VICFLLDIIYGLLLILISPWWLYRMAAQGRYRAGWKERLGYVPRRCNDRPCIWIHAVSVGEINAIGSLVKEFLRVLPEYEIVISSTTDTGISRAKKLYGERHRVFFFPLDFSGAVKRGLRRVHPQLCILMELELWPNFLAEAERQQIAVVVANGRISSGKGYPRLKRVAPLVRGMFRRLRLVLTQDEEYARRFVQLGTPAQRVQVVGSLKYDTAEIGDKAAGTDELAEQLKINERQLVWVAGSTGPGEEKIILDSFGQLRRQSGLEALRLVIVPRKPERFDEVARLITEGGHHLVRYGAVKQGLYKVKPDDDTAVILGDTMGDLRKFYSLARVAFVGRSLVPMGGSDMIEAAGLGKAIVVGPYTENFAETVKLLVARQAIEIVAGEAQLTQVIGRLLQDTDRAWSMGRSAQQVIIDSRGATGRSIEAISHVLGYQMPAGEKGIATPSVIEANQAVK